MRTPAEACAPTTVRFEHGTSAFDQRDRPSDRPSEVGGLVRTLPQLLHAAGAYLPRDNQGERRATIRMRMAPGAG